MTKRHLFVFCAALLMRAPLWLNLSGRPDALVRPDSAGYLRPAKSLIQGHGFSSSERAPWVPDSDRTPGYPVFLAAHFLLSDDLAWPSATQVLLDSATAALISLTTALVSGHPWAWLLGLLYALDPVASAHAPLMLSEPLFTFCLVLTVFLLLRAGSESARPAWVTLAGLCLGASALIRPVSSPLWATWSLALAWGWPPRLKKQALIFAAASLPFAMAWSARNWTHWGSFAFNPARSADAVYWEAAAVQAALENISMDEALVRFKEELSRRHPQPAENPVETARRIKALGREILLEHPLEMAKLFPVSAAKLLLSPGLDILAEALWPGEPLSRKTPTVNRLAGGGTLGVARQKPALWLAWAWIWALLLLSYLLAAVGLMRLWRERRRFILAVCVIPLAVLTLLSSGSWAYYRYRVPLLPLLAILGAGALKNPGRKTAEPDRGHP